jgi:hypothetical protein
MVFIRDRIFEIHLTGNSTTFMFMNTVERLEKGCLHIRASKSYSKVDFTALLPTGVQNYIARPHHGHVRDILKQVRFTGSCVSSMVSHPPVLKGHVPSISVFPSRKSPVG